MDSYSIHWKESAKRDLKSIDRQQFPKIIDSVSALSSAPYPKQHRKLLGSESSYRIRIGDYRVIYQVNTEQKIIFIYHMVSLKIFNVLGQEVAELINENREAGRYEQVFNASKLTSGVYFYRLQSGQYTQTRKLLLLK